MAVISVDDFDPAEMRSVRKKNNDDSSRAA